MYLNLSIQNQINELSDYLVQMDNHRESVEDYVNRTIDFITEAQLAYIQNEIQDIIDIEEEDFEQAYMKFQTKSRSKREEAQLLNDSDKLLNYLKQKRKDIFE